MSFIAELESRAAALEKSVALAQWQASLSGDPADEARAADLSAQYNLCFSNPQEYAYLRACPQPADHDLARQRTLLINDFAGCQLSSDVTREITGREMEIEGIFAAFRGTLGGNAVSDNDIREVLRTSLDTDKRKDAWSASQQVGEQVAPKLLELVRLRNREARRLGYANYYAMRLELQEVDQKWLFDLLGDLERRTDPLFATYRTQLHARLSKKFGVPVAEIGPWHYVEPFFQAAPVGDSLNLDPYFQNRNLVDILNSYYDQIGFDLRPMLANADLYEKPGKNQHAFCTSIGRGTGDVRVLCNLRPNADWMCTLMHEYGHAVYDDSINRSMPFFLRTAAHIMTTEAIAEMMGRLVYEEAWLTRYAGLSKDEAARLSGEMLAHQRAQLLVFTRWVLVMSWFERAMYENPDQDLNSLWWTFKERFQGVSRPAGRVGPDYAAKIHFSIAPVYYHNYLLGEITATQLMRAINRDLGSTGGIISSPALGKWLTDRVFATGARYHWNDLIERATGEALNVEYFVNDLKARENGKI
jgi:peptidyl-dipeptidase A